MSFIALKSVQNIHTNKGKTEKVDGNKHRYLQLII